MSAPQHQDKFPPGLDNAYLFSLFNALSFQIVLGSPMILYAKTLQASATVLGIIAGMMPLLVIFQIPAASYVSRVGYKKFVYAGWGTRVMFIFVVSAVPITHFFLNSATRLALLLFLLFIFNLSRGISSAAWLPWITSLVPASIRGRYLSRDAACVGFGSCLAFVIAAAILGNTPQAWQFAVIFAFSALMGLASLVFLKRIPESDCPKEETRGSSNPVPWLEMAKYPPFRKLLNMNLAWSVAYGGINAFTVAYLRTQAGMSEGAILLVSSTFFLGALFSLLFGNHMDKMGSKPMLTFACLNWLIIISGWVLIAGGLLHATVPLIVALQFFMGLAASLVNMSNIRLAMAISPPMGRNHFFAIFSVVANLSLGLAPVAWGLMIDLFAETRIHTGRFEWNRFSLFFAGAGLMFALTLWLSARLEEPSAARVRVLIKDILVHSPLRVLARLWPEI